MKRKSLIWIATVFSAIGILNMSCEENIPLAEDEKLTDLDIELASDDAIADNIYEEIDANVLEKLTELDENNYQTTATKSADDDFTCLVVTVDHPDSTRFPKLITFDYGEGCSVVFNGDTITKKGIILVTLTNNMHIPGSQHIVTFQDFYFNDIKVEGTRTITYNGLNDDDLLDFTIVLEEGKLIFIDPESAEPLVYSREERLQKEWYRARVAIEDTIFVNGSIWGVDVYGQNYSREIIEELTLVHCPGYGRRWIIVDGQILSIVGDRETIVDYSDGDCEATALIRRERATHRIRIHERHRNRTGGKS